jgi:YVTN family beta-propeller protein
VARLTGHKGRIHDLAVAPDGKTAATINSGASRFSATLIRNPRGASPTVTPVMLNATFMGVVFSPDGTRAYVSHGQSGDVRVLDTETLRVVTVIPTGPRSWWMALSPDGRFLHVTVGRANEVAVIDTQSNAVVRRVPAGTLPWGIAIADVP